MKNALSHIFLLLGILFLILGTYFLHLRYSPRTLTFDKSPVSVNSLSYGAPQSIQIPSINKNLPIIPAIMKNNSWETTHDGVSYLASSPQPGEKGNSILYGHNWSGLLSDLYKVKPGQKIIVTNEKGKKITFIIEYTAVVNPNQTYIIDNTNDTRITLYTCTGFLDSKRFVVVAKPVV